MPLPHIAIAKAGQWLLTQAGLILFDTMKQRLVENIGLSEKQPSLSDEQALLDTYFHQFQETLAQKIIDRLDEDRLVTLNSAISQLKMASRTSLKQGYLESAASKFFDIASLPNPGTTAGIPNAQLRSLAYFGIAAIHIEVDEVIAENLAAGILADIPTAKVWFGDELVQKFLEQNPHLRSSVSALQLPAPHSLQFGIQQRTIPAQQSGPTTAHVGQGATSSPPRSSPKRPEAFVAIRTLQGHTGIVSRVAFSSDERTLASCSEDKTIKLWSVQTGQLLRTLQGHAGSVLTVAFSPDGHILASCGGWSSESSIVDTTVKLWSVQTGQLLRTLQGHTSSVSSVAFSPDGHTLASCGDKEIQMWSVQTGKLLRTLTDYYMFNMAFSPDGHTLASCGTDKTIKLWNMQTGKLLRTLQGHISGTHSVTFSPDGRTLAGCSTNIFLNRGSLDKTIKLWNMQTGQLLRTLQGHTSGTHSVTFSPDGRTLASGSQDKTIKLWSVQTGQLLDTLQGHTGSVSSVAFSPDGHTLASCDTDKTIIIWE